MKRRVALVTHSLALGGGIATMTAFLYRVLEQSGRYQPDIISLATSAADAASVRLRAPQTWLRGPLVQAGDWQGLPYRHVGARLVELEFQRYRPRRVLDRLLAQYDLAQFIVGIPPWACALPRLQSPRVLCTATTVWADRASRIRSTPWPQRLWLYLMTRMAQTFERRALREADFVFALSEYTRNALRPHVNPERIEIAACGVDATIFRPVDNPRQNYILCVARFSDARKNVRLLLEAYALLARRQAHVPELCLIGEPPLANIRERLQSLAIADRVRILGFQPEAALADYYRNAQFFVLSSDEEGLGIVVLEAMASGLPVVSTRCGGPETIVVEGATGFLTPVGDAQALADSMWRLVSDPGLRLHMGRAARQVAVNRYTTEAAGRVFLDKYDQLLKGRKSSAGLRK